MSLFRLWDRGLQKTRKNVFSRIGNIFQSGKNISDELYDELEALLIESDAGIEISLQLIDELRSICLEGDDVAGQVRRILKRRIQEILTEEEQLTDHNNVKPHVKMVIGVNGTGKTTTIGKLAWQNKKKGRKVLLACADTFRAAAGEQLELWAKQAKVDCVRQKTGADPAAVAFDALDAAIARGADVLFVDTAGRLHTQVNLMEELKKIRRVLDKRMPGAPHSTLLVLDATTGQNGLRQADQFARSVGVTEVALTKLDGTARGGIVLAIKQQLGLPIRWVGMGEGLEDLVPFNAEAFVGGLFGEE
ncbi:signal recognition particle-docking protein FtsY [bacterium]|nr:signal recognition particle-docking protein FtsY [bacterium]